ncbi:major facilitator superfamily domain-containing protein 2B [Carlito syrichta]|uniref:Major facilitator superfamily domain-containing protein 2B n=1 Tax=Carlito syrichta TaxID=1868482 RepID=A0A3Q0E4I3_CARSF|nr:major facilitator superfamily domain-containing protein 2B [Carlito syrichta]
MLFADFCGTDSLTTADFRLRVSNGRQSRAGRLSFCTKLCYGIGGVPNQVASSASAFYLQLFLLDVAQIPAAQVSVVLFGGKVSGAAADPVAGFFINRSRRTGSGRLMPWTGQGLQEPLSRPVALAELVTRIQGPRRTRLSAAPSGHKGEPRVPPLQRAVWREQAGREKAQAGAGPQAGPGEGAAEGLGAEPSRLYSIAAAVVAVTYPVCSSLLCLGVKERPDPSAPASGPGLSFLAGLGLTARHPPYLKLVVSFLFISAAVQVEQSYLVLFCTHAAQLHSHVQSLVLTILISAVLSTPLWEWVLQRFGKRTSAFGIFAMVPSVILLAAVPTAPVAYVVAFVSGVSIAVSLLLPWSMLPDVVDDFQLQHQLGPGLETIFYSSYVFFTKLSGAGALGISTLSLEFAGYKAGACKQAEEVVVTLKVLIGAVPTCMIITGLCILLVGPAVKAPSQDPSRQLSVRRRTSYSLA